MLFMVLSVVYNSCKELEVTCLLIVNMTLFINISDFCVLCVFIFFIFWFEKHFKKTDIKSLLFL